MPDDKKEKQDSGGMLSAMVIIIAIVLFSYLPTVVLAFIVKANMPDKGLDDNIRKKMMIKGWVAVLLMGAISTLGLVLGFKNTIENELFNFTVLFRSWGLGAFISLPFMIGFFCNKKKLQS